MSNFDVNRDIVFRLVEKKPKTNIYQVWNLQTDCCIGIVKWFPSWRHYCFFPNDETVFSDRCLLRIGNFMDELNRTHKGKKEVDEIADIIRKGAYTREDLARLSNYWKK